MALRLPAAAKLTMVAVSSAALTLAIWAAAFTALTDDTYNDIRKFAALATGAFGTSAIGLGVVQLQMVSAGEAPVELASQIVPGGHKDKSAPLARSTESAEAIPIPLQLDDAMQPVAGAVDPGDAAMAVDAAAAPALALAPAAAEGIQSADETMPKDESRPAEGPAISQQNNSARDAVLRLMQAEAEKTAGEEQTVAAKPNVADEFPSAPAPAAQQTAKSAAQGASDQGAGDQDPIPPEPESTTEVATTTVTATLATGATDAANPDWQIKTIFAGGARKPSAFAATGPKSAPPVRRVAGLRHTGAGHCGEYFYWSAPAHGCVDARVKP